jgi:hypothetical protein
MRLPGALDRGAQCALGLAGADRILALRAGHRSTPPGFTILLSGKHRFILIDLPTEGFLSVSGKHAGSSRGSAEKTYFYG